jgi:hypothetical protein
MAHNVSVCVLCVCTEIMHVKGESVRGSLRGPRLPPSLRWPSMTPSYHAFSPVQNTVTLVPSSNVSTLSLATCFFAGVLLRSRRAGMAHPFMARLRQTTAARVIFSGDARFASRWFVWRLAHVHVPRAPAGAAPLPVAERIRPGVVVIPSSSPLSLLSTCLLADPPGLRGEAVVGG